MEIKAEAKYIKISPIKARIPAKVVKGMLAVEAIEVLKYTNKKAAGDIAKVVKSAVANAKHNNKVGVNNLVIKDIQVTEGPRYKRFRPAAKGRYRPFVRRSCHIFVTLQSVSDIEKSLNSKPKKEVKAVKVETKKPVEKKVAVKKETKTVKKPAKAAVKKKK